MALTSFPTVSIADLEARHLCADNTPRRPVALVVDDEQVIADTLVVILNNAGYATRAAYDGESALEMALLVPPELLITDVVMPGMSGIQLAIAVKQIVPDCKTLLFSGQASTNDLLAQARNAGYEFAVVAKPIHPHDLLAQASRLLDPSQRLAV